MMTDVKPRKFIFLVLSTLLMVSAVADPAVAFHFPWDQGHDIFVPDPPIPDDDDDCKDCCELNASPFNAASGNFIYTTTDLLIPALGPDLDITRTYNSRDRRNGPLGHGWTFVYDQRLVETTDGAQFYTICRNGRGRRARFLLAGGNYAPPPDLFSQLARNEDGSWTVTEPSGEVFRYDPEGLLVSWSDRVGNAAQLTYDNQFLISVTGASGRALEITKGPNGKITSIVDPDGRILAYDYDEDGNLISYTDPLGNTTSYVYDDEHNLIQVIGPRGFVVQEVTYDVEDRVASYTEQGERWTVAYQPDQMQTIRSDTSDHTWTTRYDEEGFVLEVIDSAAASEVTVYDDRRRVIASTDRNGNTSTFAYDSRGNLTSVTDPLGNITSYTYEGGFNQIASITSPLGRVTRLTYDDHGNMIRQVEADGTAVERSTSFTYDAAGNLKSVTGPLGKTTSHDYDMQGNLVRTTDPAGGVTTFSYDGRGNLLSRTDCTGAVTTFTYDAMDHLLTVTNPFGTVDSSLAYDASGNMVSFTDAAGSTTTFSYDAFDRRISETDPLGNTQMITYNSTGDIVEEADKNGNKVRFVRSAVFGVSQSPVDPGLTGGGLITAVIDALGNTTGFSYDPNGNLLEITDPRGNVTTQSYDALDRPLKVTYPDGSFESFTYNAEGEQIRVMSRNGDVFDQTFDALGRLVERKYPDDTVTTFSYDLNDHVVAASNPDASYTRTYDALGRLLQEADVSSGRSVSYTYRCDGLRATMTDPEGGSTTYSYDVGSNLTSLTNPLGLTTTYTYDVLSRIVRKGLSNNTESRFSYDVLSRLVQRVNRQSGGAVISSFDYVFDNELNRLSVTTPSGTTTYSYDSTYQLLGAVSAAFSESYTYDSVGNRLTSTEAADWSYGQLNELLGYGDVVLTYDANGNRTSMTDASGVTEYTYDFEKRLRSVKLPDSSFVEYAYDPFGRRISRAVDGVKKDFVYDEEDVLAEYDDSGARVARYTHGPSIDEPISQESTDETHYYVFDGIGTVTELTDETGAVVQSYRYDAFGNIVEENGSTPNTYTFTGRELDPDTGHYYYRARYLSSAEGRFLAPDPLRFVDGANLYIYVNNNPTSQTDPSGLFKCAARTYKAGANKATIVCRGGKIGVQLGWCASEDKCFKNCCRIHESTHRNDCSNNPCKGQADGTQVYFSSGSDLKKSECNAYKADKACTVSALKGKECCKEKSGLESNLKSVNAQIKKYCS